MYYLLHDDGHNDPTMYRFRDIDQAELYLIDRFRGCEPAEEPMCEGYFGEEPEWLDPNGDRWTAYGDKPDLHISDMMGWKPGADYCVDCGEFGHESGAMGCLSPQDHEDPGIEDPMAVER
jgi:hypothetical protein